MVFYKRISLRIAALRFIGVSKNGKKGLFRRGFDSGKRPPTFWPSSSAGRAFWRTTRRTSRPDSLLGRASDAEVVLTREVLAVLRRLNPGLPDEAYRLALAQVVQDDITKSLIAQNEEKYALLRDGVAVKFRYAAGRLADKRLRLIDFDTPDNNHYLAVRELWVRGKLWLRRPDVVCFVNGLPLVFIELKRFEVHIDSAYKKNYADYKDTIPHLFEWNALVVISNGHDAQYGLMHFDQRHFVPLEATGRG